VHADASTAASTDWSQIVELYDQLYNLRPNEVVALNRAVAIASLRGPDEGLAELQKIDSSELHRYQPYHAALADLLAQVGNHDAAVGAYDRAIELTTNPSERTFLRLQRAQCAPRNG
jgi:RNA polymerase sigma-70 factor, ECF subfamily